MPGCRSRPGDQVAHQAPCPVGAKNPNADPTPSSPGTHPHKPLPSTRHPPPLNAANRASRCSPRKDHQACRTQAGRRRPRHSWRGMAPVPPPSRCWLGLHWSRPWSLPSPSLEPCFDHTSTNHLQAMHRDRQGGCLDACFPPAPPFPRSRHHGRSPAWITSFLPPRRRVFGTLASPPITPQRDQGPGSEIDDETTAAGSRCGMLDDVLEIGRERCVLGSGLLGQSTPAPCRRCGATPGCETETVLAKPPSAERNPHTHA